MKPDVWLDKSSRISGRVEWTILPERVVSLRYRLLEEGGASQIFINTRYAVRVQTGRLLLIMAQFACGSVVLVYLFQENLALRAKFS
jgi:hypothetical protein